MNEITSQHPRRRYLGSAGTQQRPWAFRRIRAAFVTVCAAVLALGIGLCVSTTHWARQSAAMSTADAVLPATSPAARAIDPALDAEINGIIAAHPQYQLGVALLDLSDGANASKEVHEYGVTEAFFAASTAKVLAAEAYYHLVETGKASLEDPLGAYTAEFQLQAMLQESNNDSWLLIMDTVGHAELTGYAAGMGVNYAPTSNLLTTAEMARILGGLYSGTLLEPGNTAQLLAYMQDTNYDTLIPAAVPADITVFHKYGLLDQELHDAGILAKGGHAYALVIYTKGDDMSSVSERTEIIHQLTQAVTDTLF